MDDNEIYQWYQKGYKASEAEYYALLDIVSGLEAIPISEGYTHAQIKLDDIWPEILENIKEKIWRAEHPREHLKNQFNAISDFTKMHHEIKKIMLKKRKSITIFDSELQKVLMDESKVSFAEFETIFQKLDVFGETLIYKSIDQQKIKNSQLRKFSSMMGPFLDKMNNLIQEKDKKHLN